MTISFEAMLLDWSETAKGGAKIVLQLPSPEELEPFRRMTLAKRGVAGQRLGVAMVEIQDDESVVQSRTDTYFENWQSESGQNETGKSGISVKPDRTVNPDSTRSGDGSTPSLPTDELKGGALARLAGILCYDSGFQCWLTDAFPERCKQFATIGGRLLSLTEQESAIVVREICGIQSRRQLDHDARAERIFHEQIRIPFTTRADR